MNVEKIIKIIYDIENKFKVEEWVIDDIHIWPLIRIDIMFNLHFMNIPNLQNEINTKYKVNQGINMLKGLYKYLYYSNVDYERNDKISKVKALFLSDTDTRVKIDNKWYDRSCDPFIEYFNKKGINSILLEKFGYPSARGNGKKELHTTLSALDFNRLKGNLGFKIRIDAAKIELITDKDESIGYWDRETLRKSFERKLPRLMYVKADTKGEGFEEMFWFSDAWVLKWFDFENFIGLLKEGVILVDIRIGQYPNGRPHDHGTAFRVFPDKLELCFSDRKKIM